MMNKKLTTKKLSLSRSGFTFMEMLLVVAILSALAFSAVSVTETSDSQFRYQDTRTRIGLIKTAVIGDTQKVFNGQPMVSGYAADIGELPEDLDSLLVKPDSVPEWHLTQSVGDPANPALGEHVINQWSGWRGYLPVPPSQTGPSFRDGWNNVGEAPNHGWKLFSVIEKDLLVQSYGSDGEPNNEFSPVDYAADMPGPSGDDPTALPDPIVTQPDYLVEINGWEVDVLFRISELAPPIEPTTLRLRIYYPKDGKFNEVLASLPVTAEERDDSNYLSQTVTLRPEDFSGDNTAKRTFEFKAGGPPKCIPYGHRTMAVIRDDTGEQYNVSPTANQPIQVVLLPKVNLPILPESTWQLP